MLSNARVPVFSIVIPVFNREQVLLRALNSVLSQTYQDFEIVIIDDGSEFSSSARIRCLTDELNDSRISIIRHEINRNGAAARNTGIKAAIGEYVCLLDSDDIWESTKLAKVAALINTILDKSTFVIHHQYCNSINERRSMPLPESSKNKNESVAHYSFVTNNVGGIQSSTICVPRILALNILFDERMRGHQDWDFTLRLGAVTDDFYFIKEPLTVRYQNSPDSVVRSLDWRYSLWFYKHVSHYFDHESAFHFYQRVILQRAYISSTIYGIIFNRLFFRALFYTPFSSLKSLSTFLYRKTKWRIRLRNVLKVCKTREAKNIMIWGANNYSKSIIKSEKIDLVITNIIDSNATKGDNSFLGVNMKTIQSVSDTEMRQTDAIILATDKHRQEMMSDLKLAFPKAVDKVIFF
jgi:glycosyltransferase involved in cell wall biosynthesis